MKRKSWHSRRVSPYTLAMLRALLIGATGATGLAVLPQSERVDLRVLAMVRDPARLKERRDFVRGDVLNVSSLAEAMREVDAVISVLGTPLVLKHVSLLSQGTQNVVEAMRKVGLTRFVCVTGMGAGDSRGHGGFVYDRLILPTLLRSIYADKDRQERVVRESGLDWTLVRPARLVNDAAMGPYRTLTRLDGVRMTTISRNEVAHFLVNEMLEGRYIRQTVNLTR